ncbi:NEW3 domain-containing protein, partial [Candidatus Bathyarchaeota archaeon]|nr:NEW3 domain-containing protein [Candidatus Bathyarchaeota archaeon]
MTRKLAVFAIIIAVVFSSTIGRSMGASYFTIIGSAWGTTSSPVESEPGDRNIPLTLTAQYTGSLAISRLTVTLHPSSGFTDSNGVSHPQAYTAGIQSNAIFQLGFNLNIASSVQVGTHTFIVQFTWTLVDSTTDEEYIDTTIRLNGRVSLVFQTDAIPLNPGQENEITLTLRNSGSGSASKVSVVISPPPQVSVLSEMPSMFSLSAGQTREIGVTVFVPATAAGAALTFTASSTYKDAYNNPRSMTQNLGFSVYTIGQASFTVSASTDSLPSGETSRIR